MVNSTLSAQLFLILSIKAEMSPLLFEIKKETSSRSLNKPFDSFSQVAIVLFTSNSSILFAALLVTVFLFEEIVDLMEPYVFDYLVSVGGSISAEHGIGLFKARYLDKNHTEENLKMMKGIKDLIDPNGIMNPYKLFHV